MKQQTGITLSGMIFFLFLMAMAVYTASRIVPAYMDNWVVVRALKDLAAQPDIQNSSDASIRNQFAKQLGLNNITLITRDDLLIERIPGGVRLSAAFSSKQPYIGSVNLCMDFQPQASSGGGN